MYVLIIFAIVFFSVLLVFQVKYLLSFFILILILILIKFFCIYSCKVVVMGVMMLAI